MTEHAVYNCIPHRRTMEKLEGNLDKPVTVTGQLPTGGMMRSDGVAAATDAPDRMPSSFRTRHLPSHRSRCNHNGFARHGVSNTLNADGEAGGQGSPAIPLPEGSPHQLYSTPLWLMQTSRR